MEKSISDGKEIFCEKINFRLTIDLGIFIVIEKNTILLFHKGYAIPLQNLHSDSNGIYIKMAAGKCWNGHPQWCNRCNGCGVLFCPAHCKCF